MLIETFVDGLLKATLILTASLIVAKTFELWDPFLLFRKAVLTSNGISEWIEKKERYLTLVATIVASAPFIGLAGTVIHIIKALTNMSGSSGDIGVISGPIALALYSTLWGLASAIPANIFYNLAQRKIQTLENGLLRQLGAKG